MLALLWIPLSLPLSTGELTDCNPASCTEKGGCDMQQEVPSLSPDGRPMPPAVFKTLRRMTYHTTLDCSEVQAAYDICTFVNTNPNSPTACPPEAVCILENAKCNGTEDVDPSPDPSPNPDAMPIEAWNALQHVVEGAYSCSEVHAAYTAFIESGRCLTSSYDCDPLSMHSLQMAHYECDAETVTASPEPAEPWREDPVEDTNTIDDDAMFIAL